ncbi:hypothetical protein M8J77_006016 [Diaphorina citri]|nr:hypothetical protein M8J77_006016 [Diaphorina citri]
MPVAAASFGCIILLILVLQIAAGGLAFFYKQRVGDEIKLFLKDTIRDYYNVTPTNQSNTATLMWNYLMAQLSCCGVDDYTDFSMSPRWNSTGLQVPAACCNLIGNKFDFQPLDPDCVHTATDANSYYRIGCYETVNNFVMGHLEIVFWVVLGLGTFELILMLLAFCLSKSESKYENSCC